MSYHTAFLWFWGQNLGPQNADLFTNLSQSHSLLEKIRAVASKVAVAFLPYSSFPETEPSSFSENCAFYTGTLPTKPVDTIDKYHLTLRK